MGEGGKVIKAPSRETDRKPGATNANLRKQKRGPRTDAGAGCGDLSDAGLAENQLADLHGTRIYARSHFVLLAQSSESAYVSAASPAGNLARGSAGG